MKRHAVLFMEFADEIADIGSEDLRHRACLSADDRHFDIPRSKGCRHLEPDEARADHYGPPRRQSLADKSAAVGESAQVMDVREIPTRQFEADRLGAGGQQERIVSVPAAVYEF